MAETMPPIAANPDAVEAGAIRPTDRPSSPRAIVLALSGGGVRATLFHLGVLAYLAQRGLLPSVRAIVSVSGGSITAAHFAQHWPKATGNLDGFLEVAGGLVRFLRSNIRDRVVVPWLWSQLAASLA